MRGERSPLLPKGGSSRPSSGASSLQDAQSLRRRGNGGNNYSSYPRNMKHDDTDDDDDDDFGSSDDNNPFPSPVHTHQRRHLPLSYASDSAAPPPTKLGLTKPRWPGFRSKAVAQTEMPTPLVPRAKVRRGRFRSSDYDAALQPRKQPPADSPMRRVAAYCTCDQISVFKLLKWLDRAVKETPPTTARFHLNGWRNKMYMGVVHSSLVPQDGHLHRKDAFYFATGCCVFWGLTIEEEAFHIQALTAFSTARVAEIQEEDMEFTYGEASRIANDEIILGSDTVEEKLALSFAMAQSAKLDVFEERVEDRIRNTKHIPFNLATTGSIQYSQTDISKLIGQLFMELADVNLHSDILDEPDFLWEDDEYEPLYKKMLKYMDVNNRVKILNKRLDILRELVEVLNQELTQQHGTKLEWIIIWLLVAEILISVVWNMIIKDLLGFFNRQ